MVQNVITVGAKATVKTAVALMNEHEIGCLIVVDKAKAVGILTERDILKRVIPKLESVGKISVGRIMSKPLVIGTPEMGVGKAIKLMFKQKIKKLPVAEKGHLVGLVTLTDLVRSSHILRWLEELPIEDTPKRMRNVVDTYLHVEGSGRKCPLVLERGYLKRCLENRCMWWAGDECSVTRLSRLMSDLNMPSSSITQVRATT